MVGHLAAQEQRYWLAWAQRPPLNGRPHDETLGTMIRRVTYHSWFHNGEAQAVRQLLGHTDLPTFVGDIQDEAPYVPEAVTLAH